ncbi:MAG: ABC transporter substrate-binding protein, partial [Actinobacteria bacterium]|nr:ABC transporter substrate-binding protein [Actinomycetota bacterium]
NINQFQFLMYRPLYWFGNGTSPNLNPSLSLASNPTYSNNNTTVVVKLKNYKWSNGESVTAQDIMFWMNMLHADKENWADYSSGALPDNLKSVTVDSPTQVTFTLTSSTNPYWFTYNELSQITPMPVAWDIAATGAAPGSGGCSAAAYATADAKCDAVYNFLSKQAGYDPADPEGTNNSLSTYATNPIWQVVDGPWKLTKFDSSGNITMVPNKTYSGPVKPTISQFKEVPFTTDSAEFNALVSGSIDVGYLPAQNITSPTSDPLNPSENNSRLSGNYNIYASPSWAVNYFPYNFNSNANSGNAGPIINQLYFRQAMQTLVDQPLYIKKISKGYGIPTYGPVPVAPKNSFASSYEKSNPYPYNPGKAKSLLSSHGWKVVPNGTSTCQNPGTGSNQCGKGIAKGAKLAFNLEYASGSTSLTQLMNAEKSSWAQAGINITLNSASFNTVLGNAVPCSSTESACSWTLENWGGGWIFAPDYYPTGEAIFQTNAGSNSGDYSNTTNDNNIQKTISTNQSLTQYENYLAKQLPVVWQPNSVAVVEVKKSLKNVAPFDPLQQLTPERWRF